MTVQAGTRRAGPYATNGVQTEFVFAFKVFAAEDVLVTLTEDGVDTEAVLTSEYTVELNSDQDNNPGGTVVMLTAPDGPTMAITSQMAIEQPAVFTNQGGFYPRVLNDSLDRLAIVQQQQAELLTRTPVAPLGGGTPGYFPVLNADGNFDYSSGLGADSGLRTDLAAPTGAALVGLLTGLSVRSYINLLPVTLEQFGGVGVAPSGTVVDNEAAFNEFRDYHADVTSDPDVQVSLQLGRSLLYGSKDCYWATGLDRLIVEGNGGVFRNIIELADSPWDQDQAAISVFNIPWVGNITTKMAGKGFVRNDGLGEYILINTVAAGAAGVVATTAAEAAQLAEGDWVIVSDGVGYIGGQPPSPQQFEYVEVASVNAGTGAINFRYGSRLRNSYSATLPSYHSGFATANWPAQAKVFKCAPQWNVWQRWRNLIVMPSVADPTIGCYFSGRDVQIDGCRGPGITGSMMKRFSVGSSNFISTYVNEPIDKMVEQASLDRSDLGGDGGCSGDGSGALVSVRGSRFFGEHRTWVRASYEGAVFNGTLNQGHSRWLSMRDCTASATVTNEETRNLTIDGTTVTYAAGVITVPIASITNGSVFERLRVGDVLHKTAAAGSSTWEDVHATILSITRSGSNILVGVNPTGSLAATTHLQLTSCEHYFGSGNLTNGSPAITDGARNTLVNGDSQAFIGNRIRARIEPLSGNTVAIENWECRGRVKEIRINVKRPYTGVTHSALFLNLFDVAPGYNTESLSIDLETAGAIVITPTSGTARAGSADTASSMPLFVSKWYLNISTSAVDAPVALSESQLLLPMITVEIEMEDPTLGSFLQQV